MKYQSGVIPASILHYTLFGEHKNFSGAKMEYSLSCARKYQLTCKFHI